MLNHQEVNIRFVARNSFRLDMEKRGVRRSSEERNFLGFKCNNKGIIETNIKGGFGVESDWPQLNKLAGKLRVSLTTLYNVCAVPWGVLSTVGGVQYRGGYHEYRGGYLEYRGGVQYRGGYHDKCGGYLEYRGGVQYRGGYHEYRGGYLEYRGGCSVPWGIS